MTWWAWGLVVWLVVSVPCAVVIGTFIARAGRLQDHEHGVGDGTRLPRPRAGDDSDDPREQAG